MKSHCESHEGSASSERRLYPLALQVLPPQLMELEKKAIQLRRAQAGEPEGDPKRDAVGLALSGGGIRSATFSLGVLQALARQGLLKRIDYISTVSGGGYVGGFLGRLFTRDWIRDPQSTIEKDDDNGSGFTISGKNVAERVESILSPDHQTHPPSAHHKESWKISAMSPMQWLRENGRYLSPNGSGDTLLATAIYLRNWLAVLTVLGVFFLAIFLCANLVRAGLSYGAIYGPSLLSSLLRGAVHLLPPILAGHFWWSPYILLPSFILFFVLLPLAWAYWLVPGVSRTGGGWLSRNPWITVLLFGIISLLVGIFLRTAKLGGPNGLRWFLIIGGAISLETFFLWLFLSWRTSADLPSSQTLARTLLLRNRFSSLLADALIITVALFGFALIDTLGQTLYAYFRYSGFARGLANFKVVVTGGAVATLIALAQKIAILFTGKNGKKRVRIPWSILAAAVAIIISVTLLSVVSSVAHGFSWGWQVPHGNPGRTIHGATAAETSSPAKQDTTSNAGAVTPRSGALSEDQPSSQRPGDDSGVPMQWFWLVSALVVTIGLSYAFGSTFQFLNQSSYATLYGARLTRAYLGASNFDRLKGRSRPVTTVIPCDETSFAHYNPQDRGGPLHLINVTFNETVSGKSQIEQRDRKGMGMALGPIGVSVGARHHALWDSKPENPPRDFEQFHVFQSETSAGVLPEPMGLGQWVGISGAAFSTGLGSRTSLGLSLLCGFANIRLGYWWDSGIDPKVRMRHQGTTPKFSKRCGAWMARLFPVQMFLLDEFAARFHGPAREYWYLSDGGHFENSGCYELIRRRVPFIILCDNGCDPDYSFEDLAGLVRKARVDLSAEITFLSDEDLKDRIDESVFSIIGPLEQLQRGKLSEEPELSFEPKDQKRKSIKPKAAAFSFVHAALAKICYDGKKKPDSLLLVIKPSLLGDEPADLIQYHNAEEDFPQQSTLDQFFDEAQWESYRKLGDWIGIRLFSEPPKEKKWSPHKMEAKTLLEVL